MHVRVVGSGDAFGSGGRYQTCIALAERTREPPTVLVDCGATTMTALREQRIDPHAIRTVLISHLHGDHFGGLPFLILDGQFRRRTEDLTVVGPPGTGNRLDAAMEVLFPGSTRVKRRFEVRVLEHVHGQLQAIGDWRCTPFEVRHASGAPAYALRVDGPTSSMAYSGDTEWTDTLLEAADSVELFLCEGYSLTPVRWHLDLGSLSNHRRRLSCRRLVLTHLSPTALESDLSAWETASDGLTFDI